MVVVRRIVLVMALHAKAAIHAKVLVSIVVNQVVKLVVKLVVKVKLRMNKKSYLTFLKKNVIILI